MFEKRISPFGLVRYGVSPDHQLTRRVIKMFDQMANHERFEYHGNCEIGTDVSMEDLRASFHAVIICTGAEQPNRPDIPGAQLRGAIDALDFARWVNGEPEAFDSTLLNRVATAVIIGNGNVALDVARMLARPAADWCATDISPNAMEALIHHRIKHIVVAGRRGSEDASFSEAELEELLSLPGWDVLADEPLPFGLVPEKPPAELKIEFKFRLSPNSILGSNHVEGVKFTHQSGRDVVIPGQLVVFATGHRGIPLTGIPFDSQRGIVPNDRGRVEAVPGCYVSGWIKRGAKGLIGQNRKDAIETVSCLMEDRATLAARPVDADVWKKKLNRSHRTVSWSDWKKLDAIEIQHGSALGRPRLVLAGRELLKHLDG